MDQSDKRKVGINMKELKDLKNVRFGCGDQAPMSNNEALNVIANKLMGK